MTGEAWDPATALEADEALTRERLAELVGDYAGIVEASEGSNADDEHDPEGATIAFERSQVGALVAQAREHLAEITAARQRLEDGSYGTCASCDEAIPQGRLEARPTARLCVGCASRSGS
ncbi:TraR/DksA family transcriptional regulator [Nocardioides iriomotensis]|uniref:TraR/DksA family transcriptional regulator n=1 Tax=Nocardioides iriomotensis TaxID=715784 RepID=A0A4Q5J371_9ACTN|nr:TraR/DksA C4-type zinc finger protein [Nocardioides iriomotensis]RYU13052.1 TraR/DksA family transcriptional regulator [Nocardioides iriomotensis]